MCRGLQLSQTKDMGDILIALRTSIGLTLGSSRLSWMVVALSGLVVLAVGARLIDGTPIAQDAAQNLQMAINLDHHGVVSLDETAPFAPTMYREPLPIATGATVVWAMDRALGAGPASEYFSGERVRLAKLENLAWLMLLWAAAIAATRFFDGSWGWSIAAGLLAARPFLSATSAEGVNNFYTELPAAALLVCSSLALALALRRGRALGYALAGVCWGCLALTKASALYVFLGTVLVLLLTSWRGGSIRLPRLGHTLLLALAGAAVVLPWMGRNWVHFDEPQISERGGLAVYTRALMNDMSPEEYRGSFYVWARPVLQPYVGALLGYGARDLRLGGRLQRLEGGSGNEVDEHDREAEITGRTADAITFYRRGRAERERLTQLYERSGLPHPDVLSDRQLAHQGLAMIEHAPLRDLAVSLPALWHSALWTFPVLLMAVVYALRIGSEGALFFALPSLALLTFFALLTPSELRPAIISVPIAVVSLAGMAEALWRRWRRRRQADRGSGNPG